MKDSAPQILVIGRKTPLLEGVCDLLQLAGYGVLRSPNWEEAESHLCAEPPKLAIADLSNPDSDAYLRFASIHDPPAWAGVPVLMVSLTQDDRIRALQGDSRNGNGHRFKFYSNTLLGMDGLLDEVKSCLA
jgi:DNA-binding response OmpR family regulator